MSMKIHCDRPSCDRATVQGPKSSGWFSLSVLCESPEHEMHFCSLRCLSEGVSAARAEFGPDKLAAMCQPYPRKDLYA